MAWSLYNTPEVAWDGPPAERVATPDVSNNPTATATPGAPMTENIAPVATAVPNALPTAVPVPAPQYPDPRKLAEICNAACGTLLLSILTTFTKMLEEQAKSRYQNDAEEFVGYHATSIVHINSLQQGIKTVTRNYLAPLQLGPGFYVLPEFHEDVLREFASQAINQNPGELTVCDVYAKGFRNMREGRVPIGGSFNPLVTLPYTALYDYLTAPITGTRRCIVGLFTNKV
jgi:hypothetical protein